MGLDRSKFRHTTRVRVRNYEIDWQGIVHNANYLLYFEVGRLAYLKHLGIAIDVRSIQHDSHVVVARNEIDYRSPALFDEELDILTRIASIRNSSFVFEGIIEEVRTRRLIAENVAVHVWLEQDTAKPQRVGEDFRGFIRHFEGENVSIEG